jgi:hypothetical protein
MTPIPDKAEEVPSVELPPLPTPNGHHCPGYERKGFTADQMREYARSAVLADRPSRGAPAGWKLVPVEPTTAMLAAAIAAYTWHAAGLNRINADRKAYAALLQHAPAPPFASLPGEGGEAELLDVLSLLQRARLYTNTTPAQCERGPFAVFRSELDAAIVKLGGDL